MSNRGENFFSWPAFFPKNNTLFLGVMAIGGSLTLGTGISLYLAIQKEHQQTIAMATISARANFSKDLALRQWATRHGGIYVPTDERTPPNPYLAHIPDRDITTPAGKPLTLMNPAYMLRQVMEEFSDLYGIRGRIVSLKYLNPMNAPDAWEEKALNAFVGGVEEIMEVVGEGEDASLRLMRPMITQIGCLKCHGFQGYEVGEVRGGIGVSVPLRVYLASEAVNVKNAVITHSVFWGVSIVLLGFYYHLARVRVREQQQARLERQQQESRFQQFFRVAPVPLCLVNQDGVIVDFNVRFKQTFGYSHGDVPTLTEWWQLAYPDPAYRQWVSETWNRAVENARLSQTDVQPAEYQVTCKNGEQRTMLISGTPIGTDFLTTFFDITERKQASVRLAEFNVSLEKKVQERTEALQAANHELEAFSFSVSHDLRAPLRAISGFSQALMEDYGEKLEGEAFIFLRMLQQSSQEMGHLIDGLLRLSRLTRGEMNEEAVDLSLLAAKVVEGLRQSEPDRQVAVEIAPQMVVQGDRQLLSAVVENLLNNAWKYTSKTVQAKIEFLSAMQDDQRVFLVCDNGVGFDMNYSAKLFAPFQRLHSASDFPGDGIGLATVQRIIRRHGGKLWAKAEVGKGATFFFTIPAMGETG